MKSEHHKTLDHIRTNNNQDKIEMMTKHQAQIQMSQQEVEILQRNLNDKEQRLLEAQMTLKSQAANYESRIEKMAS